MAQGLGKLSGRGGATKCKTTAQKRTHDAKVKHAPKKGRLQKKPKRKLAESERIEQQTTKTINKRNERLIAAKAVSVGTKFFLNDIHEKGSNYVKKQAAERDKKQQKSKVSTRMEQQIENLRK